MEPNREVKPRPKSAVVQFGGASLHGLQDASDLVNGLGDGNTTPDWLITGDLKLKLRAERSGLGNDRIYTITIESTDACGNITLGTTTVTVPHDQRKKKSAIVIPTTKGW